MIVNRDEVAEWHNVYRTGKDRNARRLNARQGRRMAGIQEGGARFSFRLAGTVLFHFGGPIESPRKGYLTNTPLLNLRLEKNHELSGCP